MVDLDPFHDLDALAPHVDATAARPAFAARRAAARRRRKVARNGAMLSCVVALSVGFVVLREPEAEIVIADSPPGESPTVVTTEPKDEEVADLAESSTTSEASDVSEIDYELLSVQQVGTPGQLGEAHDEDELDDLWADLGMEGEVPGTVDFAESVVVSITDASPCGIGGLHGFVGQDDVITPEFVYLVNGCEAPIPLTYLVALERAPLEPGFTLRLATDPAPPEASSELRVELYDD